MKTTADITVNGKEVEIANVHMGVEEFVQLAVGGLPADMNYQVLYRRAGLETTHYLLPHEKLLPEDGMTFTVTRK